MMSRFCFRPTVRTCTGLFVLASIFALLVAITNASNSAISESTQSLDSEALNARSKIGKVLGNCSLQRTEVSACVSGYLATVTAIQNFVNNSMGTGETEELRISPVYARCKNPSVHPFSNLLFVSREFGEVYAFSLWTNFENETIDRLSKSLYYLTGWLRVASLNPNPILCGTDYFHYACFRQELMPVFDLLVLTFMGFSTVILICNLSGVRYRSGKLRDRSEEVFNVLRRFCFALIALFSLSYLHWIGAGQFYGMNKIHWYYRGRVNLFNIDVAVASLPPVFIQSLTCSVHPTNIFEYELLRATGLFVVALLVFLISLFLAFRSIQIVLLTIQLLSAFLFFSLLASRQKQALIFPFIKWSIELSVWSFLWQGAFRNLWGNTGLGDGYALVRVELLIFMYTLFNALVIWRGRTLILRYRDLLRSALSPGVVHVQ